MSTRPSERPEKTEVPDFSWIQWILSRYGSSRRRAGVRNLGTADEAGGVATASIRPEAEPSAPEGELIIGCRSYVVRLPRVSRDGHAL